MQEGDKKMHKSPSGDMSRNGNSVLDAIDSI